MDLVVAGVFGIIYVCLGWAESSTRQFWRPFFRVDLSPVMVYSAGIICRYTVKLAYFLFAFFHALLYMALLVWPTYLPLLLLFRDFGLILKHFARVGTVIFSSSVCPPLLIIASDTILDWLGQFPWCEWCINYIWRYVLFSLEPLNSIAFHIAFIFWAGTNNCRTISIYRDLAIPVTCRPAVML